MSQNKQTDVYFDDERGFALNMGKTKAWFTVTSAHFAAWAKKSGIPWQAIKPHLQDALEKARTLWPVAHYIRNPIPGKMYLVEGFSIVGGRYFGQFIFDLDACVRNVRTP